MPVGELLERIEQALIRLGRDQHKTEEKSCVPFAQYVSLRYVAEQPRVVSDLAELLGITTAGTTGLVDRLCKQGLVDRYRDEADRRLVWVRITDAGRAALCEMNRFRSQVLRDRVSVLSAVQLETFTQLLEKVASGRK